MGAGESPGTGETNVMEEKIGEALVRIGAMTKDQVETVLETQRGGDSRLFGEIAIERGFINDKAIMAYLDSKKS
jgi:hypothetical protein